MSLAPAGEFALIERHFRRRHPLRHAELGIGDDCALLRPLPGEQLAVSTDMLVAGRHFFADVDPASLGHKALAVNLSDLAACAAQPLAFTLALALPVADDAWLQAFASGLFALADQHGCELIGGDTTRGPLTLCITVFGSVPPGQALLRSGGQVGDDVYVSHPLAGGLGDARLALALLQHKRGTAGDAASAALLNGLDGAQRAEWLAAVRQRLESPTPRVELGLALRGLAHAAADLSDGLAGDLGHILAASGVGATLFADDGSHGGLMWALGPTLRRLGPTLALEQALAGGDDYELVLTATPAQRGRIAEAAARLRLGVTRIGRIDAEPGLRWRDADGQTRPLAVRSFDHFAQ